MIRTLFLFALAALALVPLALPAPARADPADINAAARGVVRIIVIGRDGEEIFPISHGTGFAVTPELVVTNAHVVAEAIADERLSLGIVPSDGGDAVFARLISVSQRTDLALLETTSPLHLPPLTISGNPAGETGPVTSVGYPQNVDRAQGLEMEDIFRAQPPVKSMGFLSGRRPSREFDTLLHTAPIARGSSGGPLLDECGRVIGVNSFGAESAGTDAEFFFAVSTRELLPFLRSNGITPLVNAMPCRSLAELENEERAREAQRRAASEAEAMAEEQVLSRHREETRRTIVFTVIAEREARMAIAFVLLLVAAMAGGGALIAAQNRRRDEAEEESASDNIGDDTDFGEDHDRERAGPAIGTLIGGVVAVAALAGALAAWLSRPAFSEIDGRLEDRLHAEMASADNGRIDTPEPAGAFTCTLDQSRSRVVSEAATSLSFAWSDGGCVNDRTQYGLLNGVWSRVFVPASEAAISVNQFDPATGELLIERYLLEREPMRAARMARGEYQAPACPGSPDAARLLGDRQASITASLPERPNERLVYACTPAGVDAEGPFVADDALPEDEADDAAGAEEEAEAEPQP